MRKIVAAAVLLVLGGTLIVSCIYMSERSVDWNNGKIVKKESREINGVITHRLEISGINCEELFKRLLESGYKNGEVTLSGRDKALRFNTIEKHEIGYFFERHTTLYECKYSDNDNELSCIVLVEISKN